jgi:phenylacetate-CoA ligase
VRAATEWSSAVSGVYEPLFRRVLFPLYESRLRRRRTLHHLADYERNQWLSPEQITALQWQKLRQLLDHCWREVPYYRRRWKEAGATPQDIRSMADFVRLPILTKADIRANFRELHATSWAGRMQYKATGGSTGEPLRFGYTRESYERRMAVMWRGYGWAGARMGRRTLYLWSGAVANPGWRQRTKERLFHAAFARRMLDSFTMSESNMASYAAAIGRYRPEIMVAYVDPLVRLAEWMLTTGYEPHRPQAILTGAEALSAPQRAIIERAFRAPVYNTYGCREFMLIASECEQRDGLHINADHLLVETTGGDATGSADVVITDLHNYGMPFVRYVNGDLATAEASACACGRGLPRLKRVEGRKLDAIRTRDGHTLPGEFFPHLLKEFEGVIRFQVVQRALDSLDLSIVRGADFDPGSVERIRSEIAKVIGADTRVGIHFVDAIPLLANGKFRVTISEIAPNGADN